MNFRHFTLGIVGVVSLFSQFIYANILDGKTLEPVSIEQMVGAVPKGSIFIIGERHGFQALADEQLELLAAIKASHGSLDVGMEFLYYPDQSTVNAYRSGQIGEAEFLSAIAWGQPDYSFYRGQILFPCMACGEMTWALNAPRALTSAVAAKGLPGLTKEEKSYLPPGFELGRDSYLERFAEAMGGHVPKEKLERYFAAQSVWDDTMAWKAGQVSNDQTLVIIVGEFHVAYGGGLPDRIRARWPKRRVMSLSQVLIDDMSWDELWQEVGPHPKYGPRADYISIK